MLERCGAFGRVRYTGLTSEDAKFAMFVFSVDHLGKVSSFPPSCSARVTASTQNFRQPV